MRKYPRYVPPGARMVEVPRDEFLRVAASHPAMLSELAWYGLTHRHPGIRQTMERLFRELGIPLDGTGGTDSRTK